MSEHSCLSTSLDHLFVRPMTVEDLPVVMQCELATEAFPWTSEGFAEFLSLPYGYAAVLCCEQVVGFAVMTQVLDEVNLLKIAVLPAWQTKGLGCFLLEHLLVRSQDRGVKSFFLEVRFSNNNARSLYNKLGFEIVGQRKNYYPAVDGRENALVMKKEIV